MKARPTLSVTHRRLRQRIVDWKTRWETHCHGYVLQSVRSRRQKSSFSSGLRSLVPRIRDFYLSTMLNTTNYNTFRRSTVFTSFSLCTLQLFDPFLWLPSDDKVQSCQGSDDFFISLNFARLFLSFLSDCCSISAVLAQLWIVTYSLRDIIPHYNLEVCCGAIEISLSGTLSKSNAFSACSSIYIYIFVRILWKHLSKDMNLDWYLYVKRKWYF